MCIRDRLLLAVPVMAGALYVFAQPEVKEVPRQIQSELQQKEADDYSSLIFFFKQKTAYEIYRCDWSSDVCSSDLVFQYFLDRRIVFLIILVTLYYFRMQKQIMRHHNRSQHTHNNQHTKMCIRDSIPSVSFSAFQILPAITPAFSFNICF